MIKTVNVYEFHINVKIDSEVFENNKLFLSIQSKIPKSNQYQEFPNSCTMLLLHSENKASNKNKAFQIE